MNTVVVIKICSLSNKGSDSESRNKLPSTDSALLPS